MKQTSTRNSPNVLLVVCDQLTPFLTGAYGHPAVRTPNLDSLVSEGVRFDAAYTSVPLCAPARASLMTGRHASSLGCYDNATAFAPDVPTFAHYLANTGYDTVLSGKMHFIGPDQLHGFRTRLTTDSYPSNFAWMPRREPHMDRANAHASVHANAYVTAGVHEWSRGLAYDAEVQFRAIEYLRSRPTTPSTAGEPGSDRPFLLCVSYHHPHDPFYVTQAMWDAYEGANIDIPTFPDDLETTYSTLDRWLNLWHGVGEVDLRNPDKLRALRRAYYALVGDIDTKLGQLLEVLDDGGMRENTAVIFLSDHGDMLGEKGMVQKRALYEWSSRIPLVGRLPGRWSAGAIVRDVVSILDLHPTICELAGTASLVPHDGQSLVPQLEGTSAAANRVIFAESHAEGIYAPCFMARKGNVKLIEVHGHDRQLFDLERDPGEWHNLAGDAAWSGVERELLHDLGDRFDADSIESEIRASIARRTTVRDAMRRNATTWDYQPFFDARSQYWRPR